MFLQFKKYCIRQLNFGTSNECNLVVIALCVVQFWFEIILVISDQTHAACSFDLEIMHMISDQIALHSVLLSLFISLYISLTTNDM